MNSPAQSFAGFASSPTRSPPRSPTRHAGLGAAVFLVLTIAALFGGGCASESVGSREFVVGAGAYPKAFDSTRQVLRDMGFELDRVDASAGVLTTKLHFSHGLFEPWDSTQSTLADEWEDAVNMQGRVVRVTFVADKRLPVSDRAEGDTGEAQAAEVGPGDRARLGRVQVTIYRQQRAGRQLDSESVGSSSFYYDPQMALRHGMQYLVPIRRDRALEGRIGAQIAKHLEKPT